MDVLCFLATPVLRFTLLLYSQTDPADRKQYKQNGPILEVHSEPCQISNMALLLKVDKGCKLLSIFLKRIHLRRLTGF